MADFITALSGPSEFAINEVRNLTSEQLDDLHLVLPVQAPTVPPDLGPLVAFAGNWRGKGFSRPWLWPCRFTAPRDMRFQLRNG